MMSICSSLKHLLKDEPLFWSSGKGTDVWEIFVAAMNNHLSKIKSLLNKYPSLIRCQYDYRTPMSFAVRENQLEVAAFLLEMGANPVNFRH
jgi:ankyrin repeat protein